MDWLDKVHMEVQAEIDFEASHPQHLHGTNECPGCKLPLLDGPEDINEAAFLNQGLWP